MIAAQQSGEEVTEPYLPLMDAHERHDLVSEARAFLADRFSASWDDLYMQVDGNEVLVTLESDGSDSGSRLIFTEIEVEVPGQRLGGRVIEAIKDFCDQTGVGLIAGPVVNYEYFDCHNGHNPYRHPWLEEVGDEHGDPVYGYTPTPPRN